MRRRRLRLCVAGLVVVAALGLVVVGRPGGEAERSTAESQLVPAGAGERRPPVQPRNPVERTAARFAADWLDYLAGARPVSAVRGARADLLASFAGGEVPDAGPGRQGLRGVRCVRRGERRHLCVARADELGRLRFTAVAGERRVEIVELELE